MPLMTQPATLPRSDETAANDPAPRKDRSNPAFAARLKTAMDRVNLPADGRGPWVSRLLSVDLSFGGFTVNGRNRPSYEKTRLLARRLGVSHEWLREGRGPMLSGNEPLELAEPMVLAYVPANKVPAGAVVLAADRKVVDYAEYEGLSARLVDAEDRLETMTTPTLLNGGDPRRADDELARAPVEWAAKAAFLVGEAMQKTISGDTARSVTESLNQAFDALRGWAFAMKGKQQSK